MFRCKSKSIAPRGLDPPCAWDPDVFVTLITFVVIIIIIMILYHHEHLREACLQIFRQYASQKPKLYPKTSSTGGNTISFGQDSVPLVFIFIFILIFTDVFRFVPPESSVQVAVQRGLDSLRQVDHNQTCVQ